jgi:signal transduction histidine kinase/ligand-binding sensor domain-containing protein
MKKQYLMNYEKNVRKFLAGVIIIFTPILASTQQVSFSPISLPGLDGSVLGITQDNNGFLWFATNGNGIYKYNGTEYINYTNEENNLNFISSNRVECIHSGTDGKIWIGTFDNGLDCFDPETETFTHYTHKIADSFTIRSNSIRAIMESKDGILWIGTADGLDYFDPANQKFYHVNVESPAGTALNQAQIRILYEDKTGAIWIGCGSPFPSDYSDELSGKNLGGLYKYDRNTGKITQYIHKEGDYTSLSDNRVRAIFEDSRGVFWVGTAGDGLHIMDRETGTFQRCLYDPDNPNKISRPPVNKIIISGAVDHITFITEDSQGFIWIGTFSGGINRYNPVKNKMEFYGTSAVGENKLDEDDFWTCFKTKDNLLWISTTWQSGKIYKISTTSGNLNYSQTDANIWDFVQDKKGTIWFATNSGLRRKNINNGYDIFLPNKNNGLENIINHIEADSQDNLWVSTQKGLYYFNTKSLDFKSYRQLVGNTNTISSDTVYNTQLNDDGTIWIGTFYGLDLLDTKTGTIKQFKNTVESSNWLDNVISYVIKDSSGNLWIGTVNGLYRKNTDTGEFIEMIKKSYMFVNKIFEDSQHRIWAGTNNGLLVKYPDNNGFKWFNDSTGLITNTIVARGITEDKEHALWIVTRNGLMRLNPDTKNAVFFGRSWNIDPAMSYNNIFTAASGELFWGYSSGYYHFFPKDIEQPESDLTNLYLRKFYIDNTEVIPGSTDVLMKPLAHTKKISLNYLQNNFTIEFDNIDYLTDPTEINVLYKLDNYDKTWRRNNSENQANYYNVDPGNYVFRVKASNLYGIWTEKVLEIEIKQPWYKTIFAYIVYLIIIVIVGWNVHIFQKNRTIRKVREQVKDKELEQAREIEKAYNELKTTQAQLIQSEKMASLGELTAGIAHEIQNPLNFVNNFSELSNELIDELKSEKAKGKSERNEALEDEILDDISQNLEKINHHGKRADAIVKGMLQHSRTSTGQKEPTDINALADEYLRLSYHGLRAKDKSFNANMKTEFDESLPKIYVIPQDIGRVLLNLINNAFYAVDKRAKEATPQPPEGGVKNVQTQYRPTVTISTTSSKSPSGDSRLNDAVGQVGVRIVVKDNGPGIPSHIIDKIFQPFFTTKPTGQGTGLGLSLSYDIVKAHGGELKVETKPARAGLDGEGEGTEFTILLPII